MTPSSKQYFSNLGIDVEFNTIGRNDSLIQSYIANTQSIVSLEPNQTSEYVKNVCYSLFYTFVDRPKLTGFENFKEQDIEFRINSSNSINQPQVRQCLVTEKNPSSNDFKNLLISSISDFTKPVLLYLSGGLDSELLANILLEAGKPFTPVIFCWTKNAVVQNQNEVQFAFDFCASHGLTPIVKSIDLPSLWASEHFKQLSIDIQIASPQLVTHAYMVKLMSLEIGDMQHLFGGEIRYRTNYVKDDNSLANIILLGKVSPGYNGATYNNFQQDGAPIVNYLTLNSNGTWVVQYFPSQGETGPGSGTFAVAPLNAAGYEYRITAISSTFPSSGHCVPASAPTAYSPINGGAVCETWSDNNGEQRIDTFSIQIRPVGHPATVQSSNITFNVAHTGPAGG
jgi:hypothetical protein